MKNIYRSLLLLLVGATQKELARQVRYLTVENQLLRSQAAAPSDRHQRKSGIDWSVLAPKLGDGNQPPGVDRPPDTLRRWIREDRRGKRKAPVGSRQTPHPGADPPVDRQAGP